MPARYSRKTLIAATDVLKSLGHAGFEKFSLEFDLPVGAVHGTTLKERANSLVQYVLGRSVEPIIAGVDEEIVKRAMAQIQRPWSSLSNVTNQELETFQKAVSEEDRDSSSTALTLGKVAPNVGSSTNQSQWVSAADAVKMLAPILTEYSARMRICDRAFAGLIRAHAERFCRDDIVSNDCDVPKEFWWAKGHEALDQDWAVGDFSTWIDRRIELKAFGVMFLRSDIEKMLTRGSSTAVPLVEQTQGSPTMPAQNNEPNRRVFVVHGRDESLRDKVVNALYKAKCRPIVLSEQVDAGQTIIEKIEKYGAVDFAVVLLSPDDFGGLNGEAAKPRARQNVLLELGYFFGRLKRNKLAVLMKDEVEFPSDFAGVVWKPVDAGGAWRTWLARELDAAGIPIDWSDFHS